MKCFKQKLVIISPLLLLKVALIFHLTLLRSMKLNRGNKLVEKVQSMSKEDSDEESTIN